MLESTTGRNRLMFVEPVRTRTWLTSRPSKGSVPPMPIVLIGPEGGWDPQELADAAAAGVTLLSFGGRVLRADAAGASVISVLRYVWRDL